ncbi:MAG: sterol desaturase family protein [Lewinellaceae bacterium]|nr:sterol desaturase family protein [Lewinellaceae bacterium]HPR01696.1 sterol desaturase family protein [Saprospiraceae bacterium]HQU54239.1 sterol desaturase family protein [Saprospiraceae bacterium]
MNLVIGIIITLITYSAMEFVAWFTHKYIMHGVLWSWHRDHHVHEPGFFEKNDRFFLIFAIPSATFFILGSTTELTWMIWAGLGILLYGVTYFLVHDVFIHQRFKWFRNTNNAYFRAIRRAHKIHHKHLTKEDGECFGMLVVPWKFFNR